MIIDEIKTILEKNGYKIDSEIVSRIQVMLDSIRDDNKINELNDIIEWFKKKRGMYFSKNGYELVGIEVPIEYELPNKIKFIGYIDVLIKDLVGEFGGFPSYSIAEDYALLLQITNKHPIGFVNEQLVDYLIHEKNISRNLEKTLKEVVDIYNYWILKGDEDVKKICYTIKSGW